MATKKDLHSNLAIPPGEFLEEVLEDLDMTKDELAKRMGRPATKLSKIFKGEKAITATTALQLEKVIGVPAHIWTGLEAEYRLVLARQEQELREKQIREEIPIAKNFPYSDLVKAGEIEDSRKPIERVKNLQDFFGVFSLESIINLKRYQVAFRVGRSQIGDRSPEAIAAWLRMGELRAQKTYCSQFSKSHLEGCLNEIRNLTLQKPKDFQDSLKTKLAECGVALVICRHFKKTKTHGATFWLGSDKAVLMLTIRNKWADIFWFSLFHEIGHLLLHGKQGVILEEDGSEDARELEADAFAAKTLIPSLAYKNFVARNNFYPADIKKFAKEMGIHTGIVVGRLQHDELIRQEWKNELRTRYELKAP